MNVVQNTSQLAGRLESRARAFTSSSKVIPWEDSSDNTRLKVWIWEVIVYGWGVEPRSVPPPSQGVSNVRGEMHRE